MKSGTRSSSAMESHVSTWADVAPHLVAVAAGRAPADLVVRGARLVNVQSREVLDGWQVAVAHGRFAYVGPDAAHTIGDDTRVIEAGCASLVEKPAAPDVIADAVVAATP